MALFGIVYLFVAKLLVCSCLANRPCQVSNGGCSHTCAEDLAGNVVCGCRTGYHLATDNKTCTDTNECTRRGACSQDCHNNVGSYTCSCKAGYYKTVGWPRYCHAEGEDPYIFAANVQYIFMSRLDKYRYQPIVLNASRALAGDFDYRSNSTFWSDIGSRKIIRFGFGKSRSYEVFVDDAGVAEGIAVDWIYRHLYWTESSEGKIHVIDLQGINRKTLLDSNLDHPMAIVLFPQRRLMFWSDVGNYPRIERAGMNGEQRRVLLSNTLSNFTGLTIDIVLEKLYWVDAYLNQLGRCDLDGRNKAVIVTGSSRVDNPFGLTLFEDFLYWSSRGSNTIQRTTKFRDPASNSSDFMRVVYFLQHKPYGLMIYHEARQPPGKNHCGSSNGGCSHFCLASPSMSRSYSCACPDNMILRADGKTCVIRGDRTTLPSTVLPSSTVAPACSQSHMCSHICAPGSGGSYTCRCRSGYSLNADKRTCSDINECGLRGACSHDCQNTIGSFRCSCRQGYHSNIFNPNECTAYGRDPTLLIGAENMIVEVPLEQRIGVLIHAQIGRAAAIDFHYKKKYVVVTDVRTRRILRTSMDATDTVLHVLVQNTYSDGVAIDWIHDNLYWTDFLNRKLIVKKMVGDATKTLITFGMDKPRAIVLDPRSGWMFWSDWGQSPKIERAGMDGSQRKTIISTGLQWPNGLTIDYVMNKLYWVEGHTLALHIGVCNYDGSSRDVLLQSNLLLGAFDLTVFEDHVYWTARYSKGVYQTNIFRDRTSQTDRVILVASASITTLLGISMLHAARQPSSTNYCTPNNGGCSHFCVAAPQVTSSSPKFACMCPDGMSLRPDQKTCNTGERTVLTPETTTPIMLTTMRTKATKMTTTARTTAAKMTATAATIPPAAVMTTTKAKSIAMPTQGTPSPVTHQVIYIAVGAGWGILLVVIIVIVVVLVRRCKTRRPPPYDDVMHLRGCTPGRPESLHQDLEPEQLARNEENTNYQALVPQYHLGTKLWRADSSHYETPFESPTPVGLVPRPPHGINTSANDHIYERPFSEKATGIQ